MHRNRQAEPVVLDHAVTLRSQARSRVVRVNLLITAFAKLVRGLPDFQVTSSDIDGEGCIEVHVPGCANPMQGAIAPGRVEVEVHKLDHPHT